MSTTGSGSELDGGNELGDIDDDVGCQFRPYGARIVFVDLPGCCKKADGWAEDTPVVQR